MTFTVAIVGRPNVGKSTLFNRLVGKRLAIVDDTPGVTRDRREGDGRLADLRFRVIDTAGLEAAGGDALEARMRTQTERALAEADVALMLIDARAGLTPLDHHFADWIRPLGTPVVLLANKCEGRAGEAGLFEAYALGLGDPVPISAEHGEGLSSLFDALRPFADRIEAAETAAANDAETPETGGMGPLNLAVVGRPNVGKSTLINRLIGEDRLLTGPEPGVTRDSIAVAWNFGGREIRLSDTAGLRRRARVVEKVESLSASDTLRALRFAHCVVLAIDARDGLERQDLTIARRVVEEGRALVIAANKWDLVKDRKKALARIHERIETSLNQVAGLPVVPCSALTGEGLEKLLPAVAKIDGLWNSRVGTGPLNRWLAEAIGRHPPPMAKGRRIRLRYATQAKARPPTFVLFAGRPEELPESYLRFLANDLRDAFGLEGVPVRILTRKGKNPYAKDG